MLAYLITLIAFIIFANPATFKAVRGVAGNWVASTDGTASLAGLILHGVIFIFVVGFIMKRISVSGYAHENVEYRDKADDSNNVRFQENRIVYAVTN